MPSYQISKDVNQRTSKDSRVHVFQFIPPLNNKAKAAVPPPVLYTVTPSNIHIRQIHMYTKTHWQMNTHPTKLGITLQSALHFLQGKTCFIISFPLHRHTHMSSSPGCCAEITGHILRSDSKPVHFTLWSCLHRSTNSWSHLWKTTLWFALSSHTIRW